MKRWMLASGFALGVMALAACGGGDGGGNMQLCVESCQKANECFGTSSDCEADCMDNTNDQECSNEGEIADHIDMCNSGECGDQGMTYSECLGNTPACEM